jgi:transposase
MQCGWYKEVQVKSLSCHEVRAVMISRAQLVKTKVDLENQIRGLLKNHGLVIGKAGGNIFRSRAVALRHVGILVCPQAHRELWPKILE